MDEEQLQFFIITMGAGVLAAAIIIIDTFSLPKFWARLIRSRRPPTPERLAKAQTRHQRFYNKTHQRLFSTTYVSFYLFALSFTGLVLMGMFFILENWLRGQSNLNELFMRLSYLLLFLVVSRWYYRQEHHFTTAHNLFPILSCVILIDLVHLITGADYLPTLLFLVLLWTWTGGILRATLSFEVAYTRDIAFSLGLPFAVILFLVTSNPNTILLIMLPLFVLGIIEMVKRSELKFEPLKKFFPNPLPFRPWQPHSLRRDVLYGLTPLDAFRGCPVWEVVYWLLLTPITLVPVTQYLQGREETLQNQHDKIVQWSQNEYILSPETVADRLGLTLENTYPLLNELTEEGNLSLYESEKGLLYGLPLSEEMKAFIKKLNLRKTELPTKDRELLEYMATKERITPPTTVVLSIVKRAREIEVSTEQAGGTLLALKPSVTMKTGRKLEHATRDISRFVGVTVNTLSYFRHYEMRKPLPFLETLQSKGRELLTCAVPESMMRELEMSHLVLETNYNEIPFELMWENHFFAIKYAMGRRLRIEGAGGMRVPEEVETFRALVIADSEDELKEVVKEGDYLEKELDNLVETYYLKETEATREKVLECLGAGYAIIHYAGHADETGLHLRNGILDPEVIQETVKGRPIVFINACRSAGGVNTKLAEAFLRSGAVGYIGSVWDIHDVAAARLAMDFYQYCLQHHTVGEALRMAKEKAFRENNVAWLCFVLFGDPTLRLI